MYYRVKVQPSERHLDTINVNLQFRIISIPVKVSAMAVTAFPSEGSRDLALLNVARLFTRLEHNLLSPGTDRRALQQSEYQRMRVNKVNHTTTASPNYAPRHLMKQKFLSNQYHRM
jgi:hypothetical protein